MRTTYYEIWGNKPGKDAPEVIERLQQGDMTCAQMEAICNEVIQDLTKQGISNLSYQCVEVNS